MYKSFIKSFFIIIQLRKIIIQLRKIIIQLCKRFI